MEMTDADAGDSEPASSQPASQGCRWQRLDAEPERPASQQLSKDI